MFSEVINTPNQVPVAGTVAPGRAHTEILADLQSIRDVGSPLSEAQRNLGQEIKQLVMMVAQDKIQRTKWRELCASIAELHDEEGLRIFDIMHKIDGIDAEVHAALHSALKRAIYKRRLMADIGEIAYNSINFATNTLGPQIVTFFFSATRTARAWLGLLATLTLLINYPFLIAVPVFFIGSAIYSAIDSFFNIFEVVSGQIVANYEQSLIDNYSHIHGPRYRAEGFLQRISLFASKITTAISNKFSMKSLEFTSLVARSGFSIAVAIMLITPSIAMSLLSVMGVSFIVDSVAKRLLISHKAKVASTINESDKLCISQIDNSIAPNEEELENLNSLTLDGKMRFVKLCEEIAKSLKQALTTKSFIDTYRTLHLFDGKLGDIKNAPGSDIKLQDNRSILAIRSCFSGEGMLSLPQFKSIKDMPELSQNQQKVVVNIIKNLDTMRNYLQTKITASAEDLVAAPANIAANIASKRQPVMTHQFNRMTVEDLRARCIFDKSAAMLVKIEQRLLLTNG